jgi:DNA-3-methyladenine glycosylase II
VCSKWNLGSGGIVVRGRLAVMVAARTSASAIGLWTAEMFLLFQLDRLDIWPTGDLGVRRPYGLAWGIPMPTAKQLQPLGEPFRRRRRQRVDPVA